MDNATLLKDWKKFLIDIDKSETQVAKECGKTQQGLNRTIKGGSIKYLELSQIVEKYGYSITIHKQTKEQQQDKKKEPIQLH